MLQPQQGFLSRSVLHTAVKQVFPQNKLLMLLPADIPSGGFQPVQDRCQSPSHSPLERAETVPVQSVGATQHSLHFLRHMIVSCLQVFPMSPLCSLSSQRQPLDCSFSHRGISRVRCLLSSSICHGFLFGFLL